MTSIVAMILVGATGPMLIGMDAWGNRRFSDPIRARMAILAVGLAWSVSIWVVVSVVTPGTRHLALVGDLSAPTRDLGIIGVGESDTWRSLLFGLGGFITLATAAVVWLQIARGRSGVRAGDLMRAMPLAVVFAVMNATIEELAFRVALIQGVDADLRGGWYGPMTVAVIGAVLFGVPHYFGKPGGVVGVAMAGFLGWIACLSIYQTGGIAWAWLLHVALDIVIFTMAVAVMRSGSRRERGAQPGAGESGSGAVPIASLRPARRRRAQ